MKQKNPLNWIFIAASLIIIGVVILLLIVLPRDKEEEFNADRAYQDVITQTDLGPRTPGSEAHDAVVAFIQNELEGSGWQVEIQTAEKLGHPLQNIVARRGTGSKWVILGAHYDSRQIADRDENEEFRNQPVPGANDGASGVAVLLELARTLPRNVDKEVWLVFFDLEDQGNIDGWDWILGSQAFVEQLDASPDAVIVIDMIGDSDLNLYRERSSSPDLVDEIWTHAAVMGYDDIFIDKPKHSILDDHSPFLSAGMNAIDIIDFDYPYWHTVNDTADKVSPQSLGIIGEVLLAWLKQ
jgi:hypothetical protein